MHYSCISFCLLFHAIHLVAWKHTFKMLSIFVHGNHVKSYLLKRSRYINMSGELLFIIIHTYLFLFLLEFSLYCNWSILKWQILLLHVSIKNRYFSSITLLFESDVWMCSLSHSREFTHRVKSVSMAKFTTQEVEALQKGGNQVKKYSY